MLSFPKMIYRNIGEMLVSYGSEDVTNLIKLAISEGATEIHFKVPNRPLFRIDGLLVPQTGNALTPQNTIQIAQTLLSFAKKEIAVANVMHEEIGFGLSNRGRFHAILYRQRGSVAILLRVVPQSVVSLDELGFPDAERLLGQPGIVFITGGRRLEAMASLIDRFNAQHRGSVVTIEQPLTVLHRDAMAAISQREVGVDVESFAMGVRSGSRQRPDVLAITDVPCSDTAEAILSAAENGTQVFVCVSAPKPELADNWLLRGFAVDRQPLQESRLARLKRATIWSPQDGQGTVY